jgi:hypothetical protein
MLPTNVTKLKLIGSHERCHAVATADGGIAVELKIGALFVAKSPRLKG